MDLIEKTLESNYSYQGKVVSLRIDKVTLPNGREGMREIVEHPGAVAIVPITSEGKIIMVKQFRKPIERVTIELPAGKLDKREEPRTCALRELQEEIGHTADELEYKFSYYTTPGFSDEIMYLFKATKLQKSKLDCDDDEFIELIELSPHEAYQKILQGEIVDAKTIIGILTLLQE